MKYGQILIGIVLCIVLEYSVYVLNHKYNFWNPAFSYHTHFSDESRQGGGILTNPLLECTGSGDDEHIDELNISRFDLNKTVNDILSTGKIKFMSVYVRDLNNGPWIGINEKEEFIGGSLLKVPLLITYLKLAEDNPDLLKNKIDYKSPMASNVQYFPSRVEIEPGKSYTGQELLEHMIYYSDNNAAELLFSNIKQSDLDDTFESLGMGRPDPNVPYPVNSKTYAAFFRVLFNASYLNRGVSEKALQMLTKIDFEKGLKAFLPQDLVVAHKFGIRSDGNVNQLHDCGIVYYPKHPYLICVMSKGGSFDDLAQSIAKVSKFVYDQVRTGIKNN